MSIKILPSLVIFGLTSRLKVASANSVLVPWSDTVENGIEIPCSILATELSTVMILGEERIFTLPLSSSAERRTSKSKVPARFPRITPNPPPLPVPIEAGRSTMKPSPTLPETVRRCSCFCNECPIEFRDLLKSRFPPVLSLTQSVFSAWVCQEIL